ncbi:hypothetical protein AALA13_03560 [Lachnospiraceae bacterium 50-23]
MKEDNKAKREALVMLIESIDDGKILDYLLTYIRLVMGRWG